MFDNKIFTEPVLEFEITSKTFEGRSAIFRVQGLGFFFFSFFLRRFTYLVRVIGW